MDNASRTTLDPSLPRPVHPQLAAQKGAADLQRLHKRLWLPSTPASDWCDWGAGQTSSQPHPPFPSRWHILSGGSGVPHGHPRAHGGGCRPREAATSGSPHCRCSQGLLGTTVETLTTACVVRELEGAQASRVRAPQHRRQRWVCLSARRGLPGRQAGGEAVQVRQVQVQEGGSVVGTHQRRISARRARRPHAAGRRRRASSGSSGVRTR